jgi:hypothetical protein
MIEIPWLLISNISIGVAILCGAPLLILFFVETNPTNFRTPSIFTPFVIGVCVILILALCIFIPIHFYAESQRPYTITPEKTWTTTDIQNITSLSGDQRWSINGGGSFFLGCGQVLINGGSVPQYVFYKITPNGYQIGTLDATNVFIKEDENIYPFIEWEYSHSTLPLKRWDDNGDVDYNMNGKETKSLIATYIHVPKGTVIKEYSLGG